MKYLLFILTILISACSNPDNRGSVKADSQDTLSYQYDTVTLESMITPRDTSFAPKAYASIVYASFSDDRINKAIEARVIDDMDPDRPEVGYQNIIKSFIAAYEKEAQNENGSGAPWSMDRDQQVLFNSPNIISIQETYFWFTGGAHPNTVYISYNINPRNRSFLTIDSLIKPDKLADFNMLAERIFRSDENISPEQSLKEDYFFENNKFKVTKTFNVSPGGITFRYSPYEIKPYAAGDTELKIPADQIKDMVRDEYKMVFYPANKL